MASEVNEIGLDRRTLYAAAGTRGEKPPTAGSGRGSRRLEKASNKLHVPRSGGINFIVAS